MTRLDIFCVRATKAMIPYVVTAGLCTFVFTTCAWRDEARDLLRENKALQNRVNILEESLDMLSQSHPECATNFVAERAEIIKEYNH